MQGSSGDIEIDKKLMDMGGREEEREGGPNGESSMETYITICKIDSH